MNQFHAQSQELCTSCGSLPAIPQMDRTTDPPSTLLLCESCYSQLVQDRFDSHLANLGKELEDALRQSGSALPAGVTGEHLIRSFLEESRQYATSEQAQQHQILIARLTAEARAELPEGATDAQIQERLIAKYIEWMGSHPSERE